MTINLRLFCSWILTLACSFSVCAEIPDGYYNSIQGTKREKLKTALCKAIQPAHLLKYGGNGAGYTWEGFSKTDVAADGSVLDRYSLEVRQFNGIKAVDGMHIEHSFAKSWWGGINNNAYKDLNHLYPSDGGANIRKSNNPIGVVTEPYAFDNGAVKIGLSSSTGSSQLVKVWEPAASTKGDFARTYMYMVTCYEDFSDLWTSDGLTMLEKNTYPVFQPWLIDLLLKWNADDPVDQIERDRNDQVYAIQGNRNPFIDYPILAEYIWGSKTDQAFYSSSVSQPSLFIPEDGAVIDLGLQSTSAGAASPMTIRGAYLSQNLSVSVSNPVFSLDKYSFSPAEVTEGVDAVISCNPSAEGKYEADIVLASGSLKHSVKVLAEFINGIPALPASSIVCTSYVQSFVANWKMLPGISSVALDVYTKDADGNKTSISGYPVNVSEASHKVSGIKPNTTYFYSVSSGALSSNEISVVMPAMAPVFSADKSDISFFSAPFTVSNSQLVTLTTENLPSSVISVSVEKPFEVSADGNDWSHELSLKAGKNPSFFVRVAKITEELVADDEIIISNDGQEDIIINLNAEIDFDRAFFEDAEIGTKSTYAASDVFCTSGSWNLDNVVIGSLANDKKNGLKSFRFKGTGVAYTNVSRPNGIKQLHFFAGLYGTDTASGMALSVEFSTDEGLTWNSIVSDLAFTKGEWKEYTYDVNTTGNTRLRFSASGSASKRINVDDIYYSVDPNLSSIVAPMLNGIKVAANADAIDVFAPMPLDLDIFSIQGQRIFSSQLAQGSNHIGAHLLPGCYIVRVGSTNFKIVIK